MIKLCAGLIVAALGIYSNRAALKKNVSAITMFMITFLNLEGIWLITQMVGTGIDHEAIGFVSLICAGCSAGYASLYAIYKKWYQA